MSAADEPSFAYLGEIDGSWRCKSCDKPATDPVRVCECTLCRTCALNVLARQSKCRLCGANWRVNKATPGDQLPSVDDIREGVNAVRVICTTGDRCEWKGPRKLFDSHNCLYREDLLSSRSEESCERDMASWRKGQAEPATGPTSGLIDADCSLSVTIADIAAESLVGGGSPSVLARNGAKSGAVEGAARPIPWVPLPKGQVPESCGDQTAIFRHGDKLRISTRFDPTGKLNNLLKNTAYSLVQLYQCDVRFSDCQAICKDELWCNLKCIELISCQVNEDDHALLAKAKNVKAENCYSLFRNGLAAIYPMPTESERKP